MSGAMRLELGRVVVLAGLVVLSVTGCRNKTKEALATFDKADASFRDAKRLVAEGKLTAAHDAYQQADGMMIELRRRAGPGGFGEFDLPDGPEVAGFTPRKWQERWKEDFAFTVKQEFDSLQEKAAAGELDWSGALAFFNTHDKELADRWVKTVGTVSRAALAREGEVYHFECQATEEGFCGTLQSAIAKRAARPLTLDKPLTAEARAAAFGLIEVKSASRRQGYEQVGSEAAGLVYSLPTTLEVTLKVGTRRGSSSWDGERRLVVTADAPVTVAATEMTATRNKQLAVLHEKMARELEALPQQSVAP